MQNLWKATVCSSAAAGFSTQINKWAQCCRSFMRVVWGGWLWRFWSFYLLLSFVRDPLNRVCGIWLIHFDLFTSSQSPRYLQIDCGEFLKVWLKKYFSCSENIFLSWAVSLTVVLQICQRMRNKKERKLRLHQTMEYGTGGGQMFNWDIFRGNSLNFSDKKQWCSDFWMKKMLRNICLGRKYFSAMC